jgi:hypothetical protein
MIEKPLAGGLWRDNPDTPEGKYLVKRRDGTIPDWPSFTLGARDPCASAALRAYASEAYRLGLDKAYVNSVSRLADEWDEYRKQHGEGDPDKGKYRQDDPATIEEMKQGKSV